MSFRKYLNESKQKYTFSLEQIQSNYKIFNKKCFDNKLPKDIKIKFNSKKAIPASAIASVKKNREKSY